MSHILHKLKWILLAVLLVFCLIVIFQNIESIEVRLLMWSFHLPQAALLISTLAIGYLMGLLTPTLRKFASWRSSHRKPSAEPPNPEIPDRSV